MELVYLWVEKYKNIKEQGFNFSGQYRCDYDIDTNELTIDKNDDYVHIFPKNINVTAIVGENGSGKSSIIEIILQLLEEELNVKYILIFQDIDKTSKYLSNINSIQTVLKKGDLKQYQNIYVYNKYLHQHYAFRNYTIVEIDKVSIANLLALHYGSPTIPFKLSTFMYLPNQIEIKLSEPNELIKRSINLFSPLKREDVIKTFNSIDNIYHQFLFICYGKIKGTHSQIDVLNDIEKLKKELENYLDIVDFNRYFLQLITTKRFKISDLTQEEKDIYMKNSGYLHFFDFDMIDEKERRFDNLSHGEQMIFGQLLNIYAFSHSNKDFIFLFDEPEIALHPKWQKKYMNEVISLCKRIDKKFHFITTSHSPFILSDLPKDNVIFLEDGKQVNVKIDTFGANIHTLLSHGFFMSDGLMGEFAKSKIENVINYLNDKESTIENNEEAQKYINLIGEPILKRQLQKMLDSKRISRMDEIDELKRRIELLESKQ